MEKDTTHLHRGPFHTFIVFILCLMIFSSLGIYLLINNGVEVFHYPPLKTAQPTTSQAQPTQKPLQPQCMEQDGELTIKKASSEGSCTTILPLKDFKVSGYTVTYPNTWQVRIAGAEGMNLMFTDTSGTDASKDILMQVVSSKLPLEKADNATYAFETSEAVPLVDPDEVTVARQVEEVNGVKTLHLTTSLENVGIERYFMTQTEGGKPSVYMIKVTGDNKKRSNQVREMVGTFTVYKPQTASGGIQTYTNTQLAYTIQYPGDGKVSECADIPCASIDAYSVRIEGLDKFIVTPEKMAESLLHAELYCDAGGPQGSIVCKNEKVEEYINSNGVKGYRVLRKKTIHKGPINGKAQDAVVDDRAYVFPIEQKEYPAVMFAVDEPTKPNLTVLDAIAESFAYSKP